MKNVIFALLLFSIGSCSKDSNNDRDKFLGTYAIVENCPSGNSNYEITISTSAESDKTILLNNFGGTGTSVKAIVNGSTLTLPVQTFSASGVSVTINNGSGALNGTLLTITYGFSIGTFSESCSFTGTKK
jgi:hypothetical protein